MKRVQNEHTAQLNIEHSQEIGFINRSPKTLKKMESLNTPFKFKYEICI